MTSDPLNRELRQMFVQELGERSSIIENLVLALEQADQPATSEELQRQLLKAVHSLKGAAGLMQVRPIESLCHAMEEMLSTALKENRAIDAHTLDLFLAAVDRIREVRGSLGEEVPETSVDDSELLEAMHRAALPGDGAGARTHRRSTRFRADDMDGSLRIAAERLDALLYRSGELLTFNHLLRRQLETALALREQASAVRAPPEHSGEIAAIQRGLRELVRSLRHSFRHIQRASTALDDEVREARTLPFSEACQGLNRIIRDVAGTSGKSAELEIDGGDIQIDRTILSSLRDVLRHLVRNAIDHGIEPPDERRKGGKSDAGKIRISAAVTGDRIRVRVEDDGRGFDLPGLREAVDDGAGPDVLQQVFKPGFSTSKAVTRVSGRGLGLDIVKTAVENLRGAVEVLQVAGGGATFILTIPLSVSTIRVLEVVCADHVFALDAASVRQVVSVDPAAVATSSAVETPEGAIPAVDLARWLGLGHAMAPLAMRAVVMDVAGRRIAVLVDRIEGERKLLIRKLGPRLAGFRQYSGAMNLPDGRIALLLNTAALVDVAPEPSSPEAPILRVEPKPSRVLIVDDSNAVRSLLRLITERAGYEVFVASNGAEALEQLALQPADIVVSDIDMPEMDGLQLVETLRRSDRFAGMPVILVTGRDFGDADGMIVAGGANACLRKDRFDAEEFLETMRRVV
ncbi:MAG: response regulator [Rhizobiaceae bacterium]|nr:response regulator [Rhizobiaceae bacterium]